MKDFKDFLSKLEIQYDEEKLDEKLKQLPRLLGNIHFELDPKKQNVFCYYGISEAMYTWFLDKIKIKEMEEFFEEMFNEIFNKKARINIEYVCSNFAQGDEPDMDASFMYLVTWYILK